MRTDPPHDTPATPPTPPVPNLVCFDWGGVILRICRTFREGVEAAGLEWREGADEGEPYDVRRRASAQYQVGAITESEFFAAIAASMRGLYTPDEIAAVHDAWLIGEYHGVDRLVADLHAAGIPTAMLSNTNARHWARRQRDFPTAGALRHQHASHLLRAAKPDPAIFRAFERATEHRPGDILFFDDLEPNTTAAQAAGWQAVQVDHTADTAAQMRAALTERGLLG